MPESVVPIFRALGPLETYLSELYTHNFGTIGCAIWVDTDVGCCLLLNFYVQWYFITCILLPWALSARNYLHKHWKYWHKFGEKAINLQNVVSCFVYIWPPNRLKMFHCFKPLHPPSGAVIDRESSPSTRVHPDNNPSPPTVHQTEWVAWARLQQNAGDSNRLQLCSSRGLESNLSRSFQIQLQRRKW